LLLGTDKNHLKKLQKPSTLLFVVLMGTGEEYTTVSIEGFTRKL
jgi:hypothetical protein